MDYFQLRFPFTFLPAQLIPWQPLSSTFVPTDPNSHGNRSRQPAALKMDLTLANARIHLVETHARDGDLYIAFLEDQLANSQENLNYASAKIEEHEADILEVTESLRQRDETFEHLTNSLQGVEQPTILPI